MSRCTDCYGNISKRLTKGTAVENMYVRFIAGDIDEATKSVSVDINKPYEMKMDNDVIESKIKDGTYRASAPLLRFVET